jgi:hypothetical protein
VHFRYSDTLNILYTTMFYGLGVPTLFPIAAVTMFNQWLAERIILAYLVRQPPAMNDRLSRLAIKLAKRGPIVALFPMFYMVYSKTMFEKSWSYKMKTSDPLRANDELEFWEANWSLPLLITLTFAFTVTLY